MFENSLPEIVKLYNLKNHPNIIQIQDFKTIPLGDMEGEIAIILELAEQSLSNLIY